jgi:hypothetical protein
MNLSFKGQQVIVERQPVRLPHAAFDVLFLADETSPCSIYDEMTSQDFREVLGADDLVPEPIWHCGTLRRRIRLLGRKILAVLGVSPRDQS